MNTDQVKGTLKDAAGKVQEKFGELIDSPEQEAKGIAKQVEGTAQKKAGDLKEAVEDVARNNAELSRSLQEHLSQIAILLSQILRDTHRWALVVALKDGLTPGADPEPQSD